MRGSQSDPSHAYAPVCTCLRLPTRALTRAERVRVRGRVYHTLHHAVNRAICTVLVRAIAQGVIAVGGPFNGPTARFSVWPIRWPRRALLGAFTGLKRALLGLCRPCDCVARRGRAWDAYFHCMNPQHCAAIQYVRVCSERMA